MKKVSLVLLTALVLMFHLSYVNVFAVESSNVQIYEASYDFVFAFGSEYLTVYDNHTYSIIDKVNTQHYVTDCDSMGTLSEGFVSIYSAESHTITFATLDGYSFDVTSVRGCGDFLGSKCSVTSTDGKYGLIDTTGHYLLECEYEDIIYDRSDTFLVLKDDAWKLAKYENGKVTLEAFVKANIVSPTKDSTMTNIIASAGEHYGMISADNKLLVDFKYEYIHDLTGGLYAGINGKTTDLIAVDGKVTASIEATVLGEYSEGKIPCYMNEKFCYINKDGKVVNEVVVADTESIGSYYEGLAVVQMEDGSYSYLTENGELATKYVWDYAARFARGYALVMDVVESNTVNGEFVRSWKIIDHSFNTVEQLNVEVYVNEVEEHTTDFSNGFIRTVDNETGKMGFAYTANTYATYDCQVNGHVKGEWIVDKEAEVGVAGEKHNACIKCGVVMETSTIDPLPEGSGTETEPNDPTNPDDPGTEPNNPDKDSDLQDFIDSTADKFGITSDQLLLIAGGSLAALVLLIVIIVAVKRKRR